MEILFAPRFTTCIYMPGKRKEYKIGVNEQADDEAISR